MPSWKINCLKSEDGIVLPTTIGKGLLRLKKDVSIQDSIDDRLCSYVMWRSIKHHWVSKEDIYIVFFFLESPRTSITDDGILDLSSSITHHSSTCKIFFLFINEIEKYD